jgi:hypothetical protein
MNAPQRRRWLWLCALGAAVLGLHLVVLLMIGPAWFDPDPAPPAPPRVLQVRSVVREPPAAVVTPALAPQAAAVKPALRTAPAALRAAAQPVPASSPAELPPPPITEASTAVADAAIDIPVYATQVPPAGRWRYRMQRGLATGDADLDWDLRADGHYELRLEGRVAGVTLLDWASQGQIDAAGLAPDRFALRRRGRDRQAANFQREAGKISFSGPTHEQPLVAGAQDRLSWLLQLSAIVAAAPERFVNKASVVLFVAGARGDADVWTFEVQGLEHLDGTASLKLTREPRRLYDTRAEVWLDPAQHYLPLRVRQTPTGGSAPLELNREPP